MICGAFLREVPDCSIPGDSHGGMCPEHLEALIEKRNGNRGQKESPNQRQLIRAGGRTCMNSIAEVKTKTQLQSEIDLEMAKSLLHL